MLGKLKSMASSSAIDQVVKKVGPELQTHLNKIKNFSVSDLQDNSQYDRLVSRPALISVNASSSGITKLIPGFETKFLRMMVNLRDELVDLSGSKPQLKEGYQDKLTSVILKSFKS